MVSSNRKQSWVQSLVIGSFQTEKIGTKMQSRQIFHY